jgi:hypothetical protein
LEPVWVAQTFAAKDPSLEDICAANTSWLRGYWQRNSIHKFPLEEFTYPNPDADRWFTLPILPKTRSSRAIGLCAQAGSIIKLPIPKKLCPKKLYQKMQHPNKLYKEFHLPRNMAGE